MLGEVCALSELLPLKHISVSLLSLTWYVNVYLVVNV